MKKSLTNILARMAKDGDIETVAEILEAVAGAENPTADPVAPVAAPVTVPVATPAPVAAAAEAIADPAAVIETPEGTTITVDSDTVAEILSRLDKLVELIGCLVKPAADEDPAAEDPAEESAAAEPAVGPAVKPDVVEEIAETVEEALEAARTVQAAQKEEEKISSTDEGMEGEGITPEEISEMVSALIDLEEEQEADPDGDNGNMAVGDTLRSAMKPIRKMITRMSPEDRRVLCTDLAARRRRKHASAHDADIYAAIMKAVQTQREDDPRELGRRIQAARNVNYRNQKNLI